MKMILTKNKLKQVKKTIDDEDMLNYLKYSYLDFFDNKTNINLLKIKQRNFRK